jgi:CheY-like chemotaxis protein
MCAHFSWTLERASMRGLLVGRDMAFEHTNEVAKLLLVEDDEGARTALGDILDLEGYEVALSANGAEALEYLNHESLPDLIILDLQMPVMNGWQFRREQIKVAEFAAVPVIVITAFQSAGDIDVREIMHKPIDIQRLLVLIRQLLLAVHSYN